MRLPSLRQKLLGSGLTVTSSTLQGQAVMLLALVPTTPSVSGATPRPAQPKPLAPAGAGQRHFCHIQRPPHRPLRS